MSADELGALRVANLQIFPVVPGRMEFAAAVRRYLLQTRPQAVAVELPANLEAGYRKAIDRLPELSALLLERAGTASYLIVESADPLTEAVRTAAEIDAKVTFVEPPTVTRPDTAPFPDSYAITRVGWEAYVRAALNGNNEPPDGTAELAWRLQALDPFAATVAVVSLDRVPGLLRLLHQVHDAPEPATPFAEVTLLNPSPESLIEVASEYPYLQEKYEQYRMLMDRHLIDRRAVQLSLLREAELAYYSSTGEQVRPWQRKLLARFSRNLALTGGHLLPGIFDLVAAAQATVDDNYAWEVHHLAGTYPAQRKTGYPETVDLSAEEVFVNTKRMRIRRRLRQPKGRSKPASLKDRPQEKRPGEWAEQLNGSGICSYPPEDLVIEDYGRFLKKYGSSVLSSERRRVEPFTASMLDGVDLRETLRNWHQGKIYVHSLEKGHTDIGSVVVIFDEDRDNRYHYCTTWLGEHQNESDMAFYATHPFEHLVGPGIGRAEYGGFLMTLPSRRLYDVWSDADYSWCESKAEVLLLAGLDYSLERNVIYVAPRPPRSVFKSIAGRTGRKILYVPIGQLSADKLKKVRVVHVLDGHDKRDIAKDYLW
jgi:hypothetical protein